MYNNQLLEEVKDLFNRQWSFLKKQWPVNQEKYFHVSEIKSVKNINELKDELYSKLGVIPVYYFLSELYTANGYIGPYNEIEKGLLLLYQLVSGLPNNKMGNFIPYSTYAKLYKQFWVKRYEYLNVKVNNDINNMFSNEKIRILSAKVNNPERFKHVTMLLDGHDGRIAYCDIDKNMSELYSYKLKKPGIRTQIAIDTNEMIVYISNSEKCATNNDGTMFVKMKLEKVISKMDCVAVDGIYSIYIKDFLEKTTCITKCLNNDNFCYPMKKDNDENLNENEINFNKVFGSFRALIEHQFADIGRTFQRFNNCKAVPYMTNIKYYNIQFKVACLLRNIKLFVEKYNIQHDIYYELWRNENFDFPTSKKKVVYMLNNEQEQMEKINRIEELQDKFLQARVDDDLIDTDDELLEDEYEIEKIVDHKYENNKMIYLIKWKNYTEKDNTWTSEKDIFAKECIQQYWDKKMYSSL
jgi:Chromo (CHRromatin Organisation MOdifier) domain/DDE superfamily endonuclease